MKALESELARKEEAVHGVVAKGRIEVNGPLPADFSIIFAHGTAKATGAEPSEIKVIETNPVSGDGDVVEVVFEAPADVVKAIEDQAADENSKLATGSLKNFLWRRPAMLKPLLYKRRALMLIQRCLMGNLSLLGER